MPTKFTDEYDRVKANLALGSNSDTLSGDEQSLINELILLMAQEGPNPTHAKSLDKLRNRCQRGFLRKLFGVATDREAEGILSLSSSGATKNKKAAALKTLRHMYLLSKFGGHDTWALSLPKAYRDWATGELENANDATLKTKLKDVNEYHSKRDLKNLQSAAQKALAWSKKAGVVCQDVSDGTIGRTLVKRWFADEDNQSEDKLRGLATRLADGFQKISRGCNSGRMILTDDPTVRGDGDWENSEAFAYRLGGQRLNVVYIEKAFFGTGNVLEGSKNWARILIHELSHSQLGTNDVTVPGDTDPRYSWHPQGIAPRKDSFHTEYAMDNADSWAFFAVDAAGMLTTSERSTALNPKT